MSKHTIVVGLGFGDEGKGTMTEYFARERGATATIRFNGGQQAAHNIVREDGTHHTFSQFGAATLEGVPSYLSKHCTLDPFLLFEEALHLRDIAGINPYETFAVSKNTLVTTPFHVMANHNKESARGNNRHGSVGVGFGETIWYDMLHPEMSIRAQDLFRPNALFEKLITYADFGFSEGILPVMSVEQVTQLRDQLMQAAEPIFMVDDEYILDVINDGTVIFEGAQGLLLDQEYGFHPHTTWSHTTPRNALSLITDAGGTRADATVVGITRSYHTRHGAGPFPTVDQFPDAPHEPHNGFSEAQGSFRTGAFDLPLFRYALGVVAPDEVALTFADVHTPVMDGPDLAYPVATERLERRPQQQELGEQIINDERMFVEIDDMVNLVKECAQVDTVHTSVGPTIKDKNLSDAGTGTRRTGQPVHG